MFEQQTFGYRLLSDKRAFIQSVRNWRTDAVQTALTSDAGLANYKDKTGKTPLHHCVEIDPKKVRLGVADSLKTARALLRAGAEVNAKARLVKLLKSF